MRHIMVMNSKGGCGKSTLATNIAAYFAREGERVALADFDPHSTSLDWLGVRRADVPSIVGIPAWRDGLRSVPRDTEILVIDSPARVHGSELTDIVRRAETILVPVLPSTIDIFACSKFMEELSANGRIARHQARIAVVANRVRENTLIFEQLEQYLRKLGVPYLASLRDAQNYVRAFTRGLSVFELPEYLAWPEWQQWEPICEWLDSKRSRPH